MSRPQPKLPLTTAAGPRFLPVLLLLFVGSGCAALIYEIVWFQLLQLVIGSSAVSLGVLLGTFMGGMCLGSLLLPRLIPAGRHPLRVYALLELGIGACGVAVLSGIESVDRLYTTYAVHGLPGILLRGVVCAVCLLPPTVLMGATLPAIARWVETTPRGVSWLGFFYGGNIAGAVFGCLLAGFYLLRVHDMAVATQVAVAINVAVAVIALALAALTPHQAPAASKRPDAEEPAPGAWTVYVAIGLSGMGALGAEVIWTRLLSLMLGGTVYTFSIILAVFLIGLGIGSSLGSLAARSTARPRLVLGGCQMLLAGAVAWTAFMLAESLPYWPIDPTLATSPWFNFQLDLVRCLWAVLPAACLWGASFPLALAAVAAEGQDAGRLVGRVYAANTVGAILGAVGFSVILIGWLGTQQAQRVLIGLSAATALLVWLPLFRFPRTEITPGEGPKAVVGRIAAALALPALIGAAVWLGRSVPAIPWELVAYGRYVPSRTDMGECLFLGEGMNSSVAVTELASGVRNFHVSGKIEASSEPQDMRLQRMLGHIPALLHPRPRSVLIVGCGAGVTAGSFLTHPEVERIVVCEIEPLIPRVVAQFFSDENYHLMDGVEGQNPRLVNGKQVQVVYDDARHFVLTTPEKFDIITSDPIHPWVKGAATLYTKEYFELCRRHLNPGGLVTQWVPLYESNPDAVKSEVATFFDVFPGGTIWSNDVDGVGYDVVLLGQDGALKVDVDELQARLLRPDHAEVAKSIGDVGFKSAVELLSTYAGQGADLGEWLHDAQINTDRNLRLQYLAGMGLNQYRDNQIYKDMVAHRRYPEELFVASEHLRRALRFALRPRSGQ